LPAAGPYRRQRKSPSQNPNVSPTAVSLAWLRRSHPQEPTAAAGYAARLKGLARAAEDEKCAAYRQQFLLVVKARAVFASCKTGPDRDTDIGRLDGTIEDINGGIAESCSAQ
jgi:hypothetical protein